MKKRILVLAYAISPTRGSEYSVAWDYVTNMSEEHELVVLFGMSGNHMGEIDEMQPYMKSPLKNVTFVPVLPNGKANFLNALNRRDIFVYTFYYAYAEWHRLVFQTAKELVARETFDLVHYLGPIGYREPGYLWRLPLPYMWGPVGGTNNISINLYPALTSFQGRLKHGVRSLANLIQFRCNARLKKALNRTDLLLAATTQNRDNLIRVYQKKCFYLPENGIKRINLRNESYFENIQILQLIIIGNIDDNKSIITLLKALSLLPNKKAFVLHVVGDGPLREKMRFEANRLGLTESIIWYGKISRDKVLEKLYEAHLHCITSVMEGNPTTIWEAMSRGVPTLSLDHCGMHDVICDECGFKIPIKSYKQVVRDIAATINSCISDSTILKRKSDGVVNCAEKHLWPQRKEFFNQCYEQTIKNYYNKNECNKCRK